MGALASVLFTRVSATPYHLRYLMEDTGEPGSTAILNTGIAPAPGGADLRYDSLQATGQGSGGLPLHELVSVGVTSQASARHLLLADASVATPAIANLARAHCEITQRTLAGPRQGPAEWAVDATLGGGGSAGYACLLITPPGDDMADAYLDIHFDHSYDDGP